MSNSGRKYRRSKLAILKSKHRAGRPKGKTVNIHGFTLSEVARGANISVTHACHIFSGKRNPTLKLAARIAQFCGISLNTLAAELEYAAKIARRTGVPIDKIINK